MSYTPSNTFTGGTAEVSATEVQENLSDLRAYLHDGIATGDMDSSAAWVRTNHIQPPLLNPYLGLQTGVSGVVAGQYARPFDRIAYASSSQTGALAGAVQWIALSGSAIEFKATEPTSAVFHYQYEVMAGPDDQGTTNPKLSADEFRSVWVAPYFIAVENLESTDISAVENAAMNTPCNSQGFNTAQFGPMVPWEIIGFGSKTGTMIRDIAAPGHFVFGLAVYTDVDRVIFPTVSVALETYNI